MIKNSESLKKDLKWWGITLLGVLCIVAAIIIDRLFLVSNQIAPSGSDPGNWLTFALEMGGQSIRMAEWSYPPLVPAFLRCLLIPFEPMAALKILGAFSWILLGLSFFLMLRLLFQKLPIYIVIGISLLFTLAGFHGEVFAFGGYPQLLGI